MISIRQNSIELLQWWRFTTFFLRKNRRKNRLEKFLKISFLKLWLNRNFKERNKENSEMEIFNLWWISGDLKSVRLNLLNYPQAFLVAFLQTNSKKNHWPLEKVFLQAEMTNWKSSGRFPFFISSLRQNEEELLFLTIKRERKWIFFYFCSATQIDQCFMATTVELINHRITSESQWT